MLLVASVLNLAVLLLALIFCNLQAVLPCSVPCGGLQHAPSSDRVCGPGHGDGVQLPLPRGARGYRRPICTDIQGPPDTVSRIKNREFS